MAVHARIEKLLPPVSASFIYRVKREPGFGVYWHYHPEYQLTLVRRGQGKRFVGDDISRFEAGDLVLTGPNLPHMWCSSPAPESKRLPHLAIIISSPSPPSETTSSAGPKWRRCAVSSSGRLRGSGSRTRCGERSPRG